MIELLIGSGISMLVQIMKERLRMKQKDIMVVLFLLSILVGIIHYEFEKYNLIEDMTQILAGAGAFYAFVIRTMKK